MYLVECPGQSIMLVGIGLQPHTFCFPLCETSISLSQGCLSPASLFIPWLPTPPGASTSVPGAVVCTFSPSTTKEHPWRWWVVAFCQSGSVAQWLIPLLHCQWSRDQRAMEPHPGLRMELLCDALGSCRLLSCSKLSNLECEICRISPYISNLCFSHILFFQVFGEQFGHAECSIREQTALLASGRVQCLLFLYFAYFRVSQCISPYKFLA